MFLRSDETERYRCSKDAYFGRRGVRSIFPGHVFSWLPNCSKEVVGVGYYSLIWVIVSWFVSDVPDVFCIASLELRVSEDGFWRESEGSRELLVVKCNGWTRVLIG